MSTNLTETTIQTIEKGASFRSGGFKKAAPELKAHFLDVLADTYSVYHAGVAIGISRNTAYDWRDADPEFARAWDAAIQAVADRLEASAFKRALSGKSDLLTIFLLKGLKPEKYKENTGLDFRGASIKIEYVDNWRDQGAIGDGES